MPVGFPSPPVPVIKATSLRDLKNRVNIHDVVVRVVALAGFVRDLCSLGHGRNHARA